MACSSLNASSSPKVFRGDGDELVDQLIAACQSENRPSLEAPVLPHLIGRQLTPYFGSSEPVQEAGHPAGKPSPSSGNKRKGSPPNLTRPRSTTSVLAGTLAAPTANSSSGKVQRSVTSVVEHAAAASTPAKALEASPAIKPKKTPTRVSLDSAIATAISLSSSTYACPAMFSSPKPETLPMPTSRLLLRAAHSASPAVCVA